MDNISDLNNFFIIFNCDENGNLEILEKEDALKNIDMDVYSFYNCSYVAIVEKDSDKNVQYIYVYNLFTEYEYTDKEDILISVTGDQKPICRIWNTIYNSRGVEFIEKGTIQEEFIFYIGKLFEEFKTRYIKYLNKI